MPVPWVAICAAILFTPAQGVPAPSQAPVRQVYGDLVVEARAATFTPDVVTFREGVRATFSGEVLTADSLELRPKDKTGQATGHVLLVDPFGSLSADNLQFSWKPGAKTGAASNVHLDLAGVVMNAERAETIPGDPPTFVFTNVYGTSCARERPPLYAIRSPRMEFHPGKEGIIRHPTIYILGKRIITLPTHHFSLDPRIHGIPLPGIALSKDKVGFLWAPNFLIDKNTAATINIRSFKGEHIQATAYASRSFLAPQDASNLITPHSEFSERFADSYFDNIRVKSPLSGASRLQAKRDTLSIGTEWNRESLNDPATAVHDPNRNVYSKFLEAVYEKGGPMGHGLGYQYMLRAQNIRQNDEPFHTRALAQGSIGTEPIRLASSLYFEPRFDAASYLGTTAFGWTRLEAGVYTNLNSWLTLGAGYAHGQEFGKAMFVADHLTIKDEFTARLDFNLGPRRFAILQKRDFDRHQWYREYMASQVLGCMQVFVVSRQFPHSYELSFTFRLDDFFRILRSRKTQLGQSAVPGHSMQSHALHN